MIKRILIGLLTTCAIFVYVHDAEADASLAWWLLPDNAEELPHELQEDDSGYWKELWLRPTLDTLTQPSAVMEQALGARWRGASPDKVGKPGKITLVLGRRIVDFTGEIGKTGTVEGEKIIWADGTRQNMYEFRRRRRRRRGSANIKFGHIPLPPLASKTKIIPEWGIERLGEFLAKVAEGPSAVMTSRDLSAISQVADPNGGLLNFRYAASCDLANREKIEEALAAQVNPKLTCWVEQNPQAGSQLLAALLQRPTIDCRSHAPMTSNTCAMASVPLADGFFVNGPTINLAVNRCHDDLAATLVHEIFHLSGIHEEPAALDAAVQQSEACGFAPATLNFENPGEGFVNDFEVETRIFLFRKVRDEAVDKWNWSEGEKSFLLGTICSRMDDKYCARNYFQKAADASMQGMVELPDGNQVSWSSLAQFELFDSIAEDIPRMHQLVKYLHRDPNGVLLRRIEAGTHRLHEFFVAREALAAVQANRGVCGVDTDEHVMCEDLVEIVKTPWFRTP